MGAQDSRPLLIVVGSSYMEYREYIFAAARERYRLWLFNPVEPTWAKAYVESYSIVNCMDAAAITAAAREVAAQHEVAGFFCYDEAFIEPAAHASAAMGFHTLDPVAVANCRDKSTTRALVEGTGVRQPKSRPVATLEDARAAAEEFGYPVILKPRNLGASLGVVIAERPEDLAARFELTNGTRLPGVREFDEYVIVEEFIEGPEISVDCIVYEGTCHVVVVARKIRGTEPPFEFEEIGHDVAGTDPFLDDPDLAGQLQRIHEVLGFRNGMTHTEFKLTPRGLYLIEVNARMGGGKIPYLGQLATGVDATLAAAAVAIGQAPDVRRSDERKCASIRSVFPPFDMEVTRVTVRDDLAGPPIREVVGVAKPGMKVRLPPHGMSHSGFVVAVADTIEESHAAVAKIDHLIQVDGIALEPPGP